MQLCAEHFLQDMGSCRDLELATTFWALARLGYQPPTETLDKLLLQCKQRMPNWAPHVLTTVLYSLALIRWQPDAVWMEAYLQHCHSMLPCFDCQALSNVVYALALLQHQPGDAWRAAYFAALGKLSGEMGPQGWDMITTSCKMLGWELPLYGRKRRWFSKAVRAGKPDRDTAAGRQLGLPCSSTDAKMLTSNKCCENDSHAGMSDSVVNASMLQSVAGCTHVEAYAAKADSSMISIMEDQHSAVNGLTQHHNAVNRPSQEHVKQQKTGKPVLALKPLRTGRMLL